MTRLEATSIEVAWTTHGNGSPRLDAQHVQVGFQIAYTDDLDGRAVDLAFQDDPLWERLYDGGAAAQSGEAKFNAAGEFESTVEGFDGAAEYTLWGRTDGPYPDDQRCGVRVIGINAVTGCGVRMNASGDGYLAEYGGGAARIIRLDAGVRTEIAESFPTTGPYRRVEIDATGSTIELIVDGAVVHSVVDATHSSGVVGLWHHAGVGDTLDDFSSTAPSPPAAAGMLGSARRRRRIARFG